LVLLLASTLATSNPLHRRDPRAIEEKMLDIACNSFDDQYEGCSHEMEKELAELNSKEFRKNRLYAEAWAKATAKWQERQGRVTLPPALRTEHAVAIMVYTLPGLKKWHKKLYKKFNAAVRVAGRSPREYRDKFHFKVFHFLLTQALSILWDAEPGRCFDVYRGVPDIRFTARLKDVIRFGQFTSTSLQKEKAEDFGTATFFSVNTCYGVPIKNFSYFRNENEVLIPPYEKFEVTNIIQEGKRTHIHLRSKGIFSIYNCEWLKEKRCQDTPCDIRAGRGSGMDP
ncbi:NARE ribosyltransferase, partial [Jacana jacana]|nr:NARE ribosyltransferase [Jacana jacana]